MKGIFFSQIRHDNQGPYKKILAQVKAFEDSGINMTLIENPFVMNGFWRGNFVLRQIVSRLPFTYVYSKHVWRPEYKDADFYYIRCMLGDRYFTRFLHDLRVNNPSAKIILEFADFPATFFMTNSIISRIIYSPDILKDYLCHRQYHKFIDRIALLEDREEVYGIPVIRFANGIDTSKISVKSPAEVDAIKMIAVAAMMPFHGYDRLIESLYVYYSCGGQRKIEIHFVGGKDTYESEIPRYKKMVHKYHMERNVFFHGILEGDALEGVYNNCNLAVASLAMFRTNFYGVASSLKVREYLTKGLPVISAGEVDVLTDSFRYAVSFANDNTVIDMNKIVEFFDRVYSDDEETVIKNIREYAVRVCDIRYTMQPIIDYIKNE